ncbi:MAG: hypothetical protein J6U35_01225 [Clostridia bacterium]|nr:hypothetical protein [Clostridia bacterium]
MKFFEKFLCAALALCVALAMVACGSIYDKGYMVDGEGYGGGYVFDGDGYGGGYFFDDEMDYYPSPDAVTGEAPAGFDGDEPVGDMDDGGTSSQQQRPKAGQITASAWNDNVYYEEFLELFKYEKIDPELGEDGNWIYHDPIKGRLYDYLSQDRWGFYANNRVTVRVNSGDEPVAGALVEYYNVTRNILNETIKHEAYAVTDANGVAYIFPNNDSGTFTVTSAEYTAEGSYDAEERDVTVSLGGKAEKDNVIKLMFVVDVTGSMGDEINYLSSELTDVIERVAGAYEGVRIDLAFLFYRDDGDREKFCYFDFLTVTEDVNLRMALKNLNTQYADGGGDYPEAMDEALEMAASKDWGDENSTKIIFHEYDAPPHQKSENKACYERAVRLAAQKGIRINPVLCSGADLLCEYLAREAAIHTAGNFVFVTNHSGIGFSHHDPDLKQATVEYLNDLIVRLVKGYHSGTFEEPVSIFQKQDEQ